MISTCSCSTGGDSERTKGLANKSTVSVTRKDLVDRAHESLTSDAVNPTHKQPAGASGCAEKSYGVP